MTAPKVGMPLRQCRSLHVVARFAGRPRVALDSMWPLLLDGLLASVEVDRSALDHKTTADLPLVLHRGGVGAAWSWVASVAAPLGADSPQWAYRWQETPGVLGVECAGLEWHACGDPVAVRELLGAVDRVGSRHQAVPVARWDVVDAGPPPGTTADALWLPSGYIGRPIAARGADALGVPDAETVDGAVRPPYSRPPAITEGGVFRREWRPVLAPWTRRPGAP